MRIEEIDGKSVRMLEKVFYKNGALFTRVEEGERYYVYRVSFCPKPEKLPSEDEIIKPDEGDFGNYELIVKRITPKHHLDENEGYDFIEAYPSTSQWGTYAWTYTRWSNIKRAIKNKFLGEPFYNEEDADFVKSLIGDMTTYN